MVEDLREQCGLKTNALDFQEQPVYIAYYTAILDGLLKKYEHEIVRADYELSYIKNLSGTTTFTQPKDRITPEQIARARAVPISSILEIRATFTLCIFHDDHKPSAKIYPDNHMYCFSCGKNADVIDIYMALNGCDFKSAVRSLAS